LSVELSERTGQPMSEFIRLAAVSEIPDGGGRTVEARGRKIALFNSGGTFYAIDNACQHRGGSLGEGDVYGTRVVCPLHGWEYDFAAGCNVDDPSRKIACYAVQVKGDDVMVEI
jgi:nitrite reductase/ring-hydroxylating ferredoxin subunit